MGPAESCARSVALKAARVVFLLTACSVMALLATPSAQAVLFRAQFTSGLFPVFGFSEAVATSAEWRRSVVTGGGAAGNDALLISQVPGSDGEYGLGMDLAPSPPAQGATWYLRWRHMWSADTNFRGTDIEGSTPYMNGKLIMMPHMGGGSGIRTSVLWESKHSPFDGTVKFIIGNASGGAATRYVARTGQWVFGQLRVRSSSRCGVSDGELAVWINNNDQANPTEVTSTGGASYRATYPNLNICSADWTNIRFGAYQNKGLQASGGVHNMLFDAFEVGTSFDSAWYRGANLPAQPRNLRLVGGQD